MLMSRCRSHAMARKAMEYCHHIHGMWGTCSVLGKGMNHHVTQGSGKKHKKNGRDKSVSYLEVRRNS